MQRRGVALLLLPVLLAVLLGFTLSGVQAPPSTGQTTYAQQPLPTSAPGALREATGGYLRNERLGLAHISAAEGGTPEERYRLALSLGAGWNRFPIYWDRVQGGPDPAYDWARYDRQVADDLRLRLDILAILIGIPEAARDGDSIRGLDAPVFSDGSDTPGPDKTINPENPWAQWVHATVTRYKPGGTLTQQGTLPPGEGIRAWEIWNEPDLPQFWRGGIDAYARLLKVAYLSVKHADPSATVIYGGLTYATDDNWLARTLAIYTEDEAAPTHNWYMDAVAVHNYADPLRSGWLVTYARESLRAYGLSRPIWLTETGVPVWDDYPGPTWAVTPEVRRDHATQQQQAYFLIQSTVYAWLRGAQVVIVHQLYDDCGDSPAGTDFAPHNGALCSLDAGPCVGQAHGLYRNPRGALCFSQHPQPDSPRPAADAFRLMAQVFSEPFGSAQDLSGPGEDQLNRDTEVIAFRRPATGERVVVMWNKRFSPQTLSLPAEGLNAQFFGLDFSTLLAPDADGLYQITLPPAAPDNVVQPPAGFDAAIGGAPVFLIERPGDVIDPFVRAGSILAAQPPRTPTPAPVTPPTARPTVDPASDRRPPSARVNSLPLTSPPTFTVSWSGQDDSGIDLFIVWVRINGGEWQKWLETADTQADYAGVSGQRYEFDVWALDLAGNWSADVQLSPQAATSVP